MRPVDPAVVLAAGGVVFRTADRHLLEYAVVHRPEYDDWSLPKGKLNPGETLEEAALREVQEETGMRCRIVRDLGTTSYLDRRSRPKIVYYWLMRAVGGRFVPNGEIDEVRWLDLDGAIRKLSFDRDRTLMRALSERHEE